jgi:hypothetical protein
MEIAPPEGITRLSVKRHGISNLYIFRKPDPLQFGFTNLLFGKNSYKTFDSYGFKFLIVKAEYLTLRTFFPYHALTANSLKFAFHEKDLPATSIFPFALATSKTLTK